MLSRTYELPEFLIFKSGSGEIKSISFKNTEIKEYVELCIKLQTVREEGII